jgi:hypothetical protein
VTGTDGAAPRPSALRSLFGIYALAWCLPAFVGGYALLTMFEFNPLPVPDFFPIVHHGSLARFLLDPWQHWDGQWFLRVAERGYYPGDASAAFLPAYPSAIHVVAAVVGGDALLAACLVSWGSLAGALVALHALFREQLGEDDSLLALVLLVAFPTAFFFHAAYTESFFLLCTAVAFLAAQRGNFAVAAVAALVATLTRWTGFVLAPALVAEAWAQAAVREDGRGVSSVRVVDLLSSSGTRALTKIRPLHGIAALVPVLALPIVLQILDRAIGDPWGFNRAQRLWERRITPPWTGLIDGARVLLPGHPPYLEPLSGGFPRLSDYPGGFLEAHAYNFVAAIAGLALAFVAVRRLRASHAVFALAGVILPLMTPSRLQPLQSMPRFLVVLFPLFAVLALLLRGRPVLTACTVAVFAVLQGFFAARFALWFWVA